ncbi:MAG: hypothetical protein JXA30_02850 [Deltaproteobacteria bacterium]|nr:hypothetical protein [Deltaproteobacteria bacterium]
MRSLAIRFEIVMFAFATALLSCASRDTSRDEPVEIDLSDAAVETGPLFSLIDSDRDGLCDSSERSVGTDADKADSDNDGYPDLMEVYCGFEPMDPNSPRAEQVVLLAAEKGAAIDFKTEVLVDGKGEQYSGVFEAEEVFYAGGATAADLFVAASAIAADPPDNAFAIEAMAARFAAVQGETRLTFALRFALGEQPGFECIRWYPFSFSVKTPNESGIGIERYIVISGSVDSEESPWCKPEHCL